MAASMFLLSVPPFLNLKPKPMPRAHLHNCSAEGSCTVQAQLCCQGAAVDTNNPDEILKTFAGAYILYKAIYDHLGIGI